MVFGCFKLVGLFCFDRKIGSVGIGRRRKSFSGCGEYYLRVLGIERKS